MLPKTTCHRSHSRYDRVASIGVVLPAGRSYDPDVRLPAHRAAGGAARSAAPNGALATPAGAMWERPGRLDGGAKYGDYV